MLMIERRFCKKAVVATHFFGLYFFICFYNIRDRNAKCSQHKSAQLVVCFHIVRVSFFAFISEKQYFEGENQWCIRSLETYIKKGHKRDFVCHNSEIEKNKIFRLPQLNSLFFCQKKI